MSGSHKSPSTDNSLGAGLDHEESKTEEDDIFAQLAQKERDLILAAELGKALLDSNQELQSRYDHIVDDFTHKMEDLQQEKYNLHLELEKMEAEYQNAIKDLQDDIISLRKQLQTNDDLQVSERERSRSLREAQRNSDFLAEQVKKAAVREEELLRELNEQKEKNESSSATIKDQMDHIAMLRDQVEYLSEKLKETNQKLIEVQGERDTLLNSIEATQEQIQSLESKILLQEEKLHRQANDMVELQESNSDLQLQLEHQQQQPLYHHYSSRAGSKGNNMKNTRPQTLFFELTQEKHKQSQQQQSAEASNKHSRAVPDLSSGEHTSERSLFDELNSSQAKGRELSATSLLAEFSTHHGHCRNASDCSLSSLTEGSRKRHHNNIGGSSDDDSDGGADKCNRNSNCKQTVYSNPDAPYHHSLTLGNVNTASTDKNGNRVLLIESSNLGTSKSGIKTISKSPELFLESQTAFDPQDTLSDSSSYSKNVTDDSPQSLFAELDSYSGTNSPVLFSELNAQEYELHSRSFQEPQEQSLFTELSSRLFDDKNGSGSDSSSNCMLGVFDFHSGGDSHSQEGDRQSNESLNHSMEMRSRLESDLSYTNDWYHMTPVTAEMLEEDDFECDDDDFLVGNMVGTTLSIGDGGGGTNFNYHFYDGPVDMEKHSTPEMTEVDIHDKSNLCGKTKEQVQLTEACRQLKELVVRIQGEPVVVEEKEQVTTEDLLALVAQMRLCIDKLTNEKEEALMKADVLAKEPGGKVPEENKCTSVAVITSQTGLDPR